MTSGQEVDEADPKKGEHVEHEIELDSPISSQAWQKEWIGRYLLKAISRPFNVQNDLNTNSYN